MKVVTFAAGAGFLWRWLATEPSVVVVAILAGLIVLVLAVRPLNDSLVRIVRAFRAGREQ